MDTMRAALSQACYYPDRAMRAARAGLALYLGVDENCVLPTAGGAAAYIVMCLLIKVFPEKLMWVVSVLAALAHNAGQLAVAVWVSGSASMLYYGTVLAAAGVITGVFTGFGAMYLTRAAKKLVK